MDKHKRYQKEAGKLSNECLTYSDIFSKECYNYEKCNSMLKSYKSISSLSCILFSSINIFKTIRCKQIKLNNILLPLSMYGSTHIFDFYIRSNSDIIRKSTYLHDNYVRLGHDLLNFRIEEFNNLVDRKLKLDEYMITHFPESTQYMNIK